MQGLPPKGTWQHQEKKLKKISENNAFLNSIIYLYIKEGYKMNVYDDYNDCMIDGVITDDDDTITCGEY